MFHIIVVIIDIVKSNLKALLQSGNYMLNLTDNFYESTLSKK